MRNLERDRDDVAPALPMVSGLLAGLAVVGILLALGPGVATADAAKCFGKKVNRVVKADSTTVRLEYKDVAFIEGNKVTVIGKPYSRICAGKGRQIINAGKGTSFTDAGPGDDKIILHPSSNNNKAYGGTGDDEIIGSNGHDFIYGSPENTPGGSGDSDRLEGGGGNDHIFDYGGNGNKLFGDTGSDQLHSLGNAVSELHGGNGTDFLYSNGGKTAGGTLEKLFGEQGNDRLMANKPGTNGPAYLDGGEGDDQIRGTSLGDTIIYNSGIKKVWGEGGDDLFVTSGRGQGTFEGGAGRDTISFAAHTPSERPGSISGVMVDLAAGRSLGFSGYSLDGIENVIGSAFDDEIEGSPGQDNVLQGGLGNDVISGNSGDTIDGGLGENECFGGQMTNCNENSPGNASGSQPQIDITEGGLLIVMGSTAPDDISIGYGSGPSRFTVNVAGGGLASGLCQKSGGGFSCPVDPNNLNGMLVYGDAGADSIKLENSVPRTLTTTVNGGAGNNTINGGPSKDFISTAPGSAGSTLNGGGGLDVIYAVDAVSIAGGPDTDIFRVVDPCVGANLKGDSGTDSVVFAGAARGVKADLAGGYAEWNGGGCGGSRTSIAKDIEKLEGTDSNDHLIIGKRNKAQDGRSVIFGRGGIDVFDSRNGSIDSVTTGSGGRKNKVIADAKDNVVWGYGLAGY